MSPSLHSGFSSPARAPLGAIEGADELRSVAVTASLGMGRVGVARGNDGESGEKRGRMRPNRVKREVHAQSFFPAPRGSSRAELFSRASGKLTRRAFFPRLGEARAQSFFPAPRGSSRAELFSRASGKLARRAPFSSVRPGRSV